MFVYVNEKPCSYQRGAVFQQYMYSSIKEAEILMQSNTEREQRSCKCYELGRLLGH